MPKVSPAPTRSINKSENSIAYNIGLAMLGAAAISLGIAQGALDASIKHGKERIIAGQPLGNYQGIQYLISEMSVAVDAARSLLYWAVFMKENTPAGPPIASFKAKLSASEMAVEVTNKALQVHGGHGYCKELPVLSATIEMLVGSPCTFSHRRC